MSNSNFCDELECFVHHTALMSDCVCDQVYIDKTMLS